jgi:MOSC domain-containing protein YiiM
MKLISVNAGLPRKVEWHGRTVTTSIWKSQVQGRVHVAKLNLAGDRQSDLSVHGGIDKAVYVYPSEHYTFWRGRFGDAELPWGAFGENFTVEGLREDQVQVGALVRTGSAEFVVTQPRMPCYKLGIRFDRPEMVKLFLQSKRTGYYLAVRREGEVASGDAIEYANPQDNGLTIADIVNLYTSDAENQDLLRRASELPALPEGWKDYFRKRLWDADA